MALAWLAALGVCLMVTMTRRAYLAGPMTGLPDFNRQAFRDAMIWLIAHGWQVESPAENVLPEGSSHADYMRAGVKQMIECDTIILLPGWRESFGARVELEVAVACGFDVYEYLENDDGPYLKIASLEATMAALDAAHAHDEAMAAS